MNLLLIQNAYPPAIISPKDRLRYITSLEEAQLGGELTSYLKLIYRCVNRSLDIYLNALSNKIVEEKSLVEVKLLKIGALAQRSNESVATLRYWTKMGLLSVATSTPKGYQLFHPSMQERIHKIRELQKQRYTLEEILDRILLP